jgi:hypothetical protein
MAVGVQTIDVAAPTRSKVFLSHSAVDTRVAEELSQLLRARGVDVWDASVDIRPGDSITARIGSAMAGADTVIFLVSSAALASPWIGREIALATTGYRRVMIDYVSNRAGHLRRWLACMRV